MKNLSLLLIILSIVACADQELLSENHRSDFWLVHKGAELPITVEGNTASKTFVIFLHGGPGGSAQTFNTSAKQFSDFLEPEYALVYYDQRNAGLARGDWDEDKLTIEQHVEDLDKVIDLLSIKYGADLSIFLAGSSWGGYLGTAYLLDANRQAKVKAWLNIGGLTHRNFNNFHTLTQITTIADDEIDNGRNIDAWQDLLSSVFDEAFKNIIQYSNETESAVNALKSRAENLIAKADLLPLFSNSVVPFIYGDKYDPFLIIINDRKGTLIEQMYAFDQIMEASYHKIELPVLSVYGFYDVITPMQQGLHLNTNISTPDADKKLVILENSGHSSVNNEPQRLAEEIQNWIEKYK